MPRDIPVGNGKLLVCFDENYVIRDLFFPHVGQENHVSGGYCRLGVWADGLFSWVGTEWKRELRYQEDTLVTDVALYHDGLRLLVTCNDVVDFHENIFVRQVTVENLAPATREIRLFFSHDLNISGNSIGDTAAFDPKSGGLVHYKGPRYFLVNGQTAGTGITGFAVGQKNSRGKEGTFVDAEDGRLSGNAIAQGSVDSVLQLSLQVQGHSREAAFYWLAAGGDWQEIHRLDELVKHKTPATLIKRTADYWHLWVHKETPVTELFSPAVSSLYRRSLLVLTTQIDADGGIVAANDSDVIEFNRDTYSYVWPRDGALVANALDLAGYPALAQQFYHFAARTITRAGYFLHKYNPDGTLASSWHPWLKDGVEQLPIQEDETALVIWALWNHFVLYRDIEFIKPLYRPLIKNAADFMCRYREQETGLPQASYDLWEERHGMLSFTTGAVFGGLTAASLFCTIFGEDDKAEYYRRIASEIRDAASRHLWRKELNRFCRMVSRNGSGALEVDPTLDASLWGLFAFGLYNPDDERISATMAAMKEKLWLRTAVGGLARYDGDNYYRTDSHPGNPWFISTLWYADYLTGRAQTKEDLAAATAILEWVASHALPSGVLAEQVHPETGKPISVSPLTWSHGTFVASSRRVMRKYAGLSRCPECGQTPSDQLREDWLSQLYSKSCNAIHGICRIK